MGFEKDEAYQYAKDCVNDTSGNIPVYVKKQAESWLAIADGCDEEAEVSHESVKNLRKIMQYIIHPDLGCTIDKGLDPHAWFFVEATFCTKIRGTKERFYQTSLMEIARKNRKTFDSAVIFVLLMLTEPNFSRFFSVAPDLAESSELKLAVEKIIKVSPDLYEEIDPAFQILRSHVLCNLNENTYTPLAYSRDRMESRLAKAFLADEAGALDDYPVDAMRSSQVGITNKLGIIISTQYPNDNNVMLSEIDISKKVLDGLMPEERRRFSLLYEPDEDLQNGEKWMADDRVIYQANPVAIHDKNMMEALKKARNLAVLYEGKRENFLCKHCNILYKGIGTEGYVDIMKVKLCRRERNMSWWSGRRVWLGLDLSLSDDNTAVAMSTYEDDVIYTNVLGFIPKGNVDVKTKREKLDYAALEKDGCCVSCGDETVDYGVIEQYAMSIEKTFGVEVVQVGYDRWNAISTVQKLEAAGMECVDVKQHSSVLHPPTKLLKECILNKKFFYDDNRLLEINFANAKCREDTNLNKYVSKKHSSGKVDMVIAVIITVYLIQQEMLYGEKCFAQVI